MDSPDTYRLAYTLQVSAVSTVKLVEGLVRFSVVLNAAQKEVERDLSQWGRRMEVEKDSKEAKAEEPLILSALYAGFVHPSFREFGLRTTSDRCPLRRVPRRIRSRTRLQ